MKYVITIILIVLISGCATSKATVQDEVQLSNKEWSAKKSPLRAKYVKFKDGSSVLSFEWAGEPGKSIVKNAEPQLESDIFNALQQRCGYKRTNLIETRIVEHKYPEYYEVWVFKNKKSTRHDKTSGISVVIKALPNGGGTDINYYGNCDP